MASSFDNAPGKIFIGGISPNTTQDSIQKYFEQYGELCDCVLMQDKATGKSRCFGFVTYKDAKVVDDVLSKKHIIDSKEIDCKRAIPRDQQGGGSTDAPKDSGSYRTRKLFVGGLTQTTKEEQFKEYFEQFGTIEDSVIMVDKETGKSRGFGFVTFDSEEAVDRVVERYNENKIDGKWVECKRAQAKDLMQNAGKKGSKHGGSGRDQSSHSSQRHGRSGGSQGQGYYQTSPTNSYNSKKSSRSQPQDSYGPGAYPYQAGYMQASGRPGYEGGAPSAYAAGYDYSQNPQGYDPSGYSARGGMAGYNYPTDYPGGYNASYPYQAGYGAHYSGAGYGAGYPSQYPAGYGQQGYDPMTMAAMSGNPSASGAASASTTKGTDSTANASYAYSAGAGYGPEAYGYNPQTGEYAANAGYGYGVPQQGGAPGSKYAGQGQVGSPRQGQSDIGPVKSGSSKKQGVESRYFQPY